MNIFYLDGDPYNAAKQMVDRHVIKMILESAQLLSTAHRLLDGKEYVKVIYATKTSAGRSARRWLLPDIRDTALYAATHVNHPSSVWVRQCSENYVWLYQHFLGLLREYTYRYGKTHKCETNGLRHLLAWSPNNLPEGSFVAPPCAMPDIYKVAGDPIASYRKYYREGKSHLHKYTKRDMPDWLKTS